MISKQNAAALLFLGFVAAIGVVGWVFVDSVSESDDGYPHVK